MNALQRSRQNIAKGEATSRRGVQLNRGKAFTTDFKQAVNDDEFKQAIADDG